MNIHLKDNSSSITNCTITYNESEKPDGGSSYRFSVMDSIKMLMESVPGDRVTELCRATYRYNQAANVFFGN